MLHAVGKEQKSNIGTDKKKKQDWIFDMHSAGTLSFEGYNSEELLTPKWIP